MQKPFPVRQTKPQFFWRFLFLCLIFMTLSPFAISVLLNRLLSSQSSPTLFNDQTFFHFFCFFPTFFVSFSHLFNATTVIIPPPFAGQVHLQLTSESQMWKHKWFWCQERRKKRREHERNRERLCVWELHSGEKYCVCVRVRKRESACVSARERERESGIREKKAPVAKE